MISTDFAPNASISDALLSIKLLCNPLSWYDKYKLKKAKKLLAEIIGEKSEKVELFYNGRSALYWLLKNLKLEENEKVLVTGYTCVAVILPLISLKLHPIFIDIESKTFGMDYADFVKKYDQSKGKPKVCILQHTYGILPQSREKIIDFCEKNDIFLIEDLAHGFDWDEIETWKRPKNGAWLFSFGRSKMISSVDGGAVVKFGNKTLSYFEDLPTGKQPTTLLIRLILYNLLAVTIKSTYDIYLGKLLHLIFKTLGLMLPEISKEEKQGGLGQNIQWRFSSAQAEFLSRQLIDYPNKLIHKKKTLSAYISQFGWGNTINLPWGRFPLLIDNRDQIIKDCRNKNIYLGAWYKNPIEAGSKKLEFFGYESGMCPMSEKIGKNILNLPLNYKIDFRKVISVTK